MKASVILAKHLTALCKIMRDHDERVAARPKYIEPAPIDRRTPIYREFPE